MRNLPIFKIVVGLAALSVAPIASWRAPLYIIAGLVFIVRGIRGLRSASTSL